MREKERVKARVLVRIGGDLDGMGEMKGFGRRLSCGLHLLLFSPISIYGLRITN